MKPATLAATPLRSTQLIVLSGITLFVVMMTMVGWALYDSRQTARQQAEQQASNIALTLESEIAQQFNSLDLILQSAVSGMRIPGLATMSPAARQAILFHQPTVGADVGAIYITDQFGDIGYNSIGDEPVTWSAADREYFLAFQQHRAAGLLVGAPLKSQVSGTWRIPVSRAITYDDGSFGGVVFGGVPLQYFQSIFSGLNVGMDGSIALLRTDGTLIARYPSHNASTGENYRAAVLFRKLERSPAGVYVTRARFDGLSRIYSYRQIGNLPLVLAVGLATHEVYADWAQKAAVQSFVMTLLFVMGLSLAAALRRELRYRAQAEWLARDSARRHAEAVAHLHVLFENSPDAMFVVLVAPDGRLSYDRVNPSWERVTGIPGSLALGRSPVECLPEYLSGPVMAAWSDCLREGQPRRYAITLTPPSQASDWEVALAPVRDDSGRICRLIGVGRNMTERNKFAANMLQAQRMEAIGQLTTGVAHDFNNLLQAIVVALEMLQEQPGLDEEGRCNAAIAENAALRGASLVHQLLAFSRKQSLNPSLLRVEQVVPEVAALLSRTLGGRIIVETRTRGGVWPVLADRAQLENCLLNLALNARDAMPDGGTLLLEAANAGPDAARSAGLAAGDYVCIRIEDEGMGMAPDTLARAFEPFFTTKSVGQGTGLGLSMVQGFARQSGGDVMIESIEGRGTLVNLWLPRAADAAGAASGLDRPQTAERGRGTVVLVDDDQDVRDMLARVLGKAGFKTAVAASGAAALDMLQAGQACDVLISDQSMPGITGSELIAKVAHIRPGLATILITGFDKVTGLDNLDGHVTVLRKPFKRDVFLGEVEALLRRGAAHQAGLTALPEPAAP